MMEQLMAIHLIVGGVSAAGWWISDSRDDAWMRALAVWVAWPLVGLVAVGLGLRSLYRDVWPALPRLPRARVVDPREERR